MHNRDFTRVSIPNQVRVTHKGEESMFHVPINVSATGMRLRSPSPPAEGDTVHIEILMGDIYTVRADGKVLWEKDGEWGAQFTQLDTVSLALLMDLIRFHAIDSDKVEREFEEHYRTLGEAA